MTKRRSWADIEAAADLDFDPRATPEYEKAIWAPELGALLRTVRVEANASQTGLARDMDTSQSNIARLERGSNLPTVETLARAAQALGRNLVIGIVSDDEFVNFRLSELSAQGRIAYGPHLQGVAPSPVEDHGHGIAGHLFPEDKEVVEAAYAGAAGGGDEDDGDVEVADLEEWRVAAEDQELM